MSEFNVNKMKMNWLRRKLEFDICFPAIHIRAKYNMRGILGNVIPIHGNGPASWVWFYTPFSLMEWTVKFRTIYVQVLANTYLFFFHGETDSREAEGTVS